MSAKSTKVKKQPASKKQIVIRLLKRKSGASLDELCTATGWQPHSVRGFLSGTVRKKLKGNLESTANKNGKRCYRLIESMAGEGV